MTKVTPRRSPGVFLGAAAALWAFAFTAALVIRGLDQEVSLSAFGCHVAATVLFALGCLFAYWTLAAISLRYVLDPNGLSIHWGFVRQVIPLDKIERLTPPKPGAPFPKIEGVNWPGYHVGRGNVEGIGETLFYSMHERPEDLLYVVTPSQAYALSVPDVGAFTKAVEAQKEKGSQVALRQMPRRAGFAAQPFWQDGIAKGLAALGIVLWFAALGVVSARYPDLSQSLAISFPPLEVTRVADKSELLTLPTTALGLLVVNLVLAFAVHTWERMTARLLLVALVGLQAVFLAGAAIAVS